MNLAILSDIYPLADKFDLSPRLKQNGEGKNRLKSTNDLVWLQHEKNILLQSCIYFPICGHHNIFIKTRRLVTK